MKSINSIGIRNWIHWVQEHKGLKFIFKNCPVCIVEQINNVNGFLPSQATVESFYVPFYSEDTGEEKHILYSLNKDFQLGKTPKIKTIKDSEGHMMELDVYPQKYFKFLTK